MKIAEIKRQDLLDMSGLSDALKENDLVFLTKGPKLDAVMARPSRLAEAMEKNVGKVTEALRERLRQGNIPPVTENDIAMLNIIYGRGEATLTDIGNGVDKATSNIHRRVQTLCQRGLLNRLETDCILYRLTDAGLQAIGKQAPEL